MFDPTSIGAALTSAKAILELLRNANDAQLAIKISSEVANVQGRLIEVQQQALALQLENRQLRAEIDKVRSSVFHHSANWRVLPDGSEDGPFCPVCAGEGVEMRLTLRGVVDQTGSVWHSQCPKSHLVGVGMEGLVGRGREPVYAIPKDLVPPNRYFLTPR
jgi:hypothetical protein